MKRNITVQDKPFFVWSLDADTGVISKIGSVWEYEIRNFGYEDQQICYAGKSPTGYDFTKLSRFDRVTNNKVFSFDPDDEKVYKLFRDFLSSKKRVAKADFDRYSDICDKLESRYFI